ncbi:hypothetical protein [Nocardia xishanensis]
MHDEESEPKDPAPRPASRRYMIAAVGGAALGVLGLAAAGYFAVRSEHADVRDEARTAAQRAACAYGPTMASYDAQHLDAYFASVLDGATGDWKQEFDATSKDLREVLEQGRVVSKADSVQCAIEKSDENTATAVLVIGQTITSAGTGDRPRPGQLAITLSLRKIGDAWLVDKVSSPLLPPS